LVRRQLSQPPLAGFQLSAATVVVSKNFHLGGSKMDGPLHRMQTDHNAGVHCTIEQQQQYANLTLAAAPSAAPCSGHAVANPINADC
jgi:hypothetical protein